ncbi:pecanex-like protein 4 [Lineus longissimus]|uniref:pecanex-like protein 4 n=1 Tax=Lineus longissimus TaxID=88925 RepID=UPI002B4D1B67
MGNGVPLLNDYKQQYFWKRFPQTFLGGPKLRLGYDAPAYVYMNQVLVFLMTWILGGLFTILVELGGLKFDIGCYVYGAVMVLYVLFVQVTSLAVQKKKAAVVPISSEGNYHGANILSDEDEVEFESCCSAETFSYVVPVKKYKINIFFHALLSGGLCGMGLWYLLPGTLNVIYGYNTAATVILHIFGWLTLCIAQYSLTVGAPPEFATFRALDTYEFAPLTRPFYVAVFFAVDIIARSSASFSTDFTLANQVLHVVFIFLPLLWLIGFLAPLEAFFLWLMEQILILCFGGSAMASDVRLLIMFIVSALIFIGAYFISSDIATVIILAMTGYLLSIDWGGLCAQVLDKCQKTTISSLKINPVKGFLWQWGVFEALFHLFIFSLTGGLAAVINLNTSVIGNTVRDVMGYLTIALLVLDKIFGDMQKVYVVFGILRNRLFPSNVIRTSLFKARKKHLNRLGYVRRVLLDFVSPFVMLIYLSFKITTFTNSSVWVVLGAARAFRWLWQGTRHSLLEISILIIIDVNGVATSNTTWLSLGTGLQLLIIGLCRNRTYELLNKLYTYWTIFRTSWSDKKQRRPSTIPIMATSIFLYPLILAMTLIATALSAPLLPLFTLPIFFIGFPRPLRCWPGVVGASASVCPDTIFYRHMAPELARALRTAFGNGGLGDPDPGSHYLVRYQDRLVWVVVLERGYSYCTINIKGLELQETSCHTVEAARIDDILQEAFEVEKMPACSVNHHIGNTLTPCDAAIIETYSDAKNVLTGIIDSPDNLHIAAKSFIRSLAWVFINHVMDKNDQKSGVTETETTHLSSPPDPLDLKKKSEDKQPLPKTPEPIKTTKFTVKAFDATEPTRPLTKLAPLKQEVAGSKPVIAAVDQTETDIDALLSESWSSLKTESPPPDERPILRVLARMAPKREASVPSITGSVWSDDSDTMSLGQMSKSQVRPNVAAGLGGGTYDHKAEANTYFSPAKLKSSKDTEDDDDEGFFNNFDFGLPAVDVGSNAGRRLGPATNRMNNGIQKLGVNIASNVKFSSMYSPGFMLPSQWMEIPMDQSKISALSTRYPIEWHQYVLDKHCQRNGGHIADNTIAEIVKDSAYQKLFAQFVMACYATVYELGTNQSDPAILGPSHVHKVYTGEIPWSIASEWITDDHQLHKLVIKAYRLAVKLMIDQAILGEATTNEEFNEYLTEYDQDWYLGQEKDQEWQEAILEGKPNLLSLGNNAIKGIFSSRTLTKQEIMVEMGSLNSELVRAQWANLSLELLYMTNDDEERYSIQAHPTILRNLTVQAADPPLGYPIFSSEPISVPTL